MQRVNKSYPVLKYPTDWELAQPESQWGRHAVLLVGYNRTKHGG